MNTRAAASPPAGAIGVDSSGTPDRMSGPVYWIRSYGLMILWEMLSLRLILPIMMLVQLFMGAGLAIGLGLLFERIPQEQALYLSTGAAVITLLVVGLVVAPQMVAQQKMARTYDFLWSQPVPRIAQVMASLTVWSLVALPGMILALVGAALRYDLDLVVSPLVVPAALLTILFATSVGYAFAHALPQPMLTAAITQVLVFVILLFSPINFPPGNLPGWLAAVHRFLPFQHAAVVVRGSLTEGLVGATGWSYLVLAAWTAAGWLVTWRVLGRRK